MESIARKIEVRAVFQEFGEIVAIEGEALTVRTVMSDIVARRAASCLLAPGVGDRVLLATEDRGDSFVLAVLEQRDSTSATIAVEGDLSLRSTRGKVSIAAMDGVEIITAATARILASKLDVEAIEALSVLGGAVKAELGKVKMYASTLDSFFERITQHAKRSHRTIEEMDQVKAGHLDYAASGSAQLRGENTLVSAHELVKLNGDQVHIG